MSRRPTVLGLDPASQRPWTCALLDTAPALLRIGSVAGPGEALALALALRPDVVAIDAPLGLPLGQCCLEESCPCRPSLNATGRACERELSRLGIGCFWTTKRSIIKPMVYAAMELRRGLESRAVPVLETYPYAAKVRLFGPRIPKKTSKEGLLWLRKRVTGLLVESPKALPQATHDELDAILAGHTGVLHLAGRTETLGIPEEGTITIPQRSLV